MKRCGRLDRLLVDKGLVQSRERAKTIIMAGMVMVGDRVVDKAGTLVERDSHIRFTGRDHPYVSRGGLKLEEALRGFHVDPRDKVAMDIGAATGGFTDCLLQKGAKRVYAVDVGYGQLAWRLRHDPRVVNLERVRDGGEILALLKPQFEVGKGEVGKGGVVRDKGKHQQVLDRISCFSESIGLKVKGILESPLLGPKGNREFFICLEKIPKA
jgi:23S rRNA (cytidine1920-2'-O)/16S rRNA (cytidine1409-2'-O)-methyltransferase